MPALCNSLARRLRPASSTICVSLLIGIGPSVDANHGPHKCSKDNWRRGWDLNPRYPLRYVRFRGGSFQPLTHLSGGLPLPAKAKIPRFARNDKLLRGMSKASRQGPTADDEQRRSTANDG